jgi:hypothetical protein
MPFGWVMLDLLTRKIKGKMYKSTILGTLPLLNRKDPDPYQSDKQDPAQDPYKKKVWIRNTVNRAPGIK